jgi:hypothetical protein
MYLSELNSSSRESSGAATTSSGNEYLRRLLEFKDDLDWLGEEISLDRKRLLLSRGGVPRALYIHISSTLISIIEIGGSLKSLATKIEHLITLLRVLTIT